MPLYSIQNNSTTLLSHVKKKWYAAVEFSTLYKYVVGNKFRKWQLFYFVCIYKREDNSFIYKTTK